MDDNIADDDKEFQKFLDELLGEDEVKDDKEFWEFLDELLSDDKPKTFQFMGKSYDYNNNVLGIKNRVILRSARAVKDLIKQGYYISEDGAIPVLIKGVKQETKVYINNPITKRNMEVNGREYNNYLKNGWRVEDGTLISPKFSTVVGLFITGQIEFFDNHYMRYDDGTWEKTEPLNNHFIRDSLKLKMLPYNDKSASIISLDNDYRENPSFQQGDIQQISNFEKDPVFGALSAMHQMINKDYRILFSMDDYVPLMNSGINPFMRIVNGKPQRFALLISNKNTNNYEFFAAAKVGDEAGFCVRHCLRQFWPKDNWDNIPDCCGEEDMRQIAYQYKRIFHIYSVNDFKTPLYTFKPKDNTAVPHINLLYQFNHVILLPEAGVGKALRWAGENAEIEFFKEKEELLTKLTEICQNNPVKPMLTFNGVRPELNGFSTCDIFEQKGKHYKLKFEGHEFQPTAWTSNGASMKQFKKINGEPLQQIRLKKLRSANIVNKGITYNNFEDNKKIKTVYLYDQKRAYASYLQCPFYSGFPDPSGLYEVFEWSEDLLTAEIEGVALVRTQVLYSSGKTVFETMTIWATLPQIRYARSNNEVFEVFFAVCTNRVQDPYADVKDKFGNGKSWFNKLVGRQFMHQTFPISLATSADEVVTLEKAGQGVIGKPFTIDDAKTIWMCGGHISEPKDPEYPFMSAYVHAYQKITMHHDLISKVPFKNIVSIWVDGVKLTKPLQQPLNSDRWHPMVVIDVNNLSYGEKSFTDLHLAGYHVDNDVAPKPVKFDPFLIHKRIALLAGAGCGKTYTIKEWIKEGKSLILSASTHLASMNLCTAEETSEPMTTQKLLVLAQKMPYTFKQEYLKGADRLVVDEFTMLSRGELQKLLDLDIPLILCGDFEQLCNPVDKNPVDRQWLIDNNFLIKELHEIKRASSQETKDLYMACRGQTQQTMLKECEKANVPKRQFDNVDFPPAFERKHYIASTNEVINKINKDYADNLYKIVENRLNVKINGNVSSKGMIVIGIDTSKTFRNQEVGFLEGFEGCGRFLKAIVKPMGKEQTVLVPVCHLTAGFAITFHRCQGQTFAFPIYINIVHLFHKAMLYVAITRVPDLNFLTLIKPDATETPK